jgi:phosphatidylserine/phosphatidylglycerophosphate/cardiolipin synthase-like enzyme
VPKSQPPSVPQLALQLVQEAPETVVLGLVAALEKSGADRARTQLVADIAQAPHRAAAERFLAGWAACASVASPAAAAMALRTAACAIRVHRAETATELVWTGPNPEKLPLRRTDQALLEVIDAARQTLTIVTFAAYKVPAVAEALVRAAQRQVRIRIIIESAQVSEGKIAYEAIDALGPEVSQMAAVYVWPLEQRTMDDRGHHGSLHAKCAVADEAVLFVSSANLTAFALTLNMELGLLVRGGMAPRAVADHFTRLITHGVLESVL